MSLIWDGFLLNIKTSPNRVKRLGGECEKSSMDFPHLTSEILLFLLLNQSDGEPREFWRYTCFQCLNPNVIEFKQLTGLKLFLHV